MDKCSKVFIGRQNRQAFMMVQVLRGFIYRQMLQGFQYPSNFADNLNADFFWPD